MFGHTVLFSSCVTHVAFGWSLYSVPVCGTLSPDRHVILATTQLALDILWTLFLSQSTSAYSALGLWWLCAIQIYVYLIFDVAYLSPKSNSLSCEEGQSTGVSWSLMVCVDSELEESLLVLPFTYVTRLLELMRCFVDSGYEIELAQRCLGFLLRYLSHAHQRLCYLW